MLKRKAVQIFFVLLCLLVFYRLPRNLKIRQTSVDEISETGYFKFQCYSSDIELNESKCYPGWDVDLEIDPDEIEDIISFFPSLSGYRLFPFEWKPEGLNSRYPVPVYMKIAFGRFVDSNYYFRIFIVQKEKGYSAYMDNHGWYVLTNADAFIDAVLDHYPDKDVRIPEIRLPLYY